MQRSDIENATEKAADTAKELANDALDGAKKTVRATRDLANESLDNAEKKVERVRREVNPAVSDLAERAQELATRGIDYCANASDRARRQFQQASDATTRYVSEQPGKSVLLAAAAGAALATVVLATRSRRRD
jgi:ElaB/YqjD/DUF883 family membrane-anchored ribosome-binding protein